MKTHSFFMKLFISFTLLMIIPVSLISLIANHTVLQNSENTIGNNCVDNLKTADKAVQQLQNSLYKDSFYLTLNQSVITLNQYGNGAHQFSGDEMITVSHILDTLGKMVQSDDIYYSIYLYLDNFDYIFTTDSNLVPLNEFTDAGWMKNYQAYINQRTPLSFINTRLVNPSETSSGSGGYVTSYVYPITLYTSSMKGAVVVNLKETAVSKMINGNLNEKNGEVQIINTDGEIVSDIDSQRLCKNIRQQDYVQKILSSKKTSGYFICPIGPTKTLVSYSKTTMNNWIYVGLFPISNLMNNQYLIQRNTLLITLLVMVLGTMTAFLVSRKIYAPLRTMITTIKTKKLVSLNGNEDEMATILKAIDAISKSSYPGQEKINRELLGNAIIKILTDDYQDDNSKNILNEYFRFSLFVGSVIEIDHYNDTSENYEEKQWCYIKKLMIEIVDEIAGQDYRCMGCNLRKGEICLVLNFNGEAGDASIGRIQEIMARFQTEIGKILDNSITVGIGTCCADITGIRDSYREAQTSVRQKIKLGGGQIIVWNRSFTAGVYYYPFEAEEQIRNLLEMCRKDALLAKVDELVSHLKSRKQLSCENISQIVTQLVGNTIVKFMIEHYINSVDVFGAETNLYSEFAQMETLDEMRDALAARYTALIEYTKVTKNRRKTTDQIEQYLCRNFKQNICVNDISDYLGLSYSYVRKIFKAEKGTNIVDYLNAIRIREAKKLLLSRNRSIKDIAAAVGYNNNQSFERYFKKIVGITPADYRIKTAQANRPAQL